MYARDKARKGVILKEDCYTQKRSQAKIINVQQPGTCVGRSLWLYWHEELWQQRKMQQIKQA